MDENRLKELVLAAAFEEDGKKKLTCAAAFRLSSQHNVDLLEISRVCNRERIKICRCQLGCFK